jgi:N-acetylglucosaminyl-diphospho-decaprenol L-rhamnosyltransferase
MSALRSTDVVVVSYNTREHLRTCLESVLRDEPGMVVVVDNGSSDGSAEMVRTDFPSVRLLIDPRNRGYGAAANLGIRACDADHVLLLNSDTVLAKGTLSALGGYLDTHPRAGLAGPRLRYPDGALQPSCQPFLGTFQLALEKTPLARLLRRVRPLRERYLLSHSPHDRPRIVPWVIGAALAIRREAFEDVGGFDDAFFMYAEEVDLCYRLRQRGWEVHFAPVADVVHVGGASTSQQRLRMRARRSMSALHFYRTHYSPRRVRVLSFLLGASTRLRMYAARVQAGLRSDPGGKARQEEVLVYRELIEAIHGDIPDRAHIAPKSTAERRAHSG